jgi:hypothetical protein
MFGGALGMAFLAKALVVPIVIVALLLGAATLTRSGRRQHALAAVAGLALVSAPFVIALSRDAGHVSVGDVWKLSYLKYVLHAPYPHYSHGSPNVMGAPLHRMDFAATRPPVVRFDAGMPVTYAPVFDQGFWYAGLAPTFRPALQGRAIALNLQRYFDLFVRQQGFALAVIAMLLIVRGRPATAPRMPWRRLGGIGIAAIGLYSLVLAEPQTLAPFIVLIWAAALLLVRLPAAPGQPALLRASSIVMLAGLATNIVVFHLDGLNAMIRLAPVAVAGPVSGGDTGPDNPVDVALALRQAGVAQGDRVGVIGDAIHASWARLARVRIVAEVAPVDAASFWQSSHEDQSSVLAAFDEARVSAVIAQAPPAGASLEGWSRLGGTTSWLRVGGAGSQTPATGR